MENLYMYIDSEATRIATQLDPDKTILWAQIDQSLIAFGRAIVSEFCRQIRNGVNPLKDYAFKQEIPNGQIEPLVSLPKPKLFEAGWNEVKKYPTYEDRNPLLLYTPQREFETDDNIVKGWYEWKNNKYYSDELHEDEMVEFTHWRPMPPKP